MKQEELEIFLKSLDSRHRAVLVAAKRARQLQQGLRPLFDGKTTKVTTMALEELVAGKVTFDIPREALNEEEQMLRDAAEAAKNLAAKESPAKE